MKLGVISPRDFTVEQWNKFCNEGHVLTGKCWSERDDMAPEHHCYKYRYPHKKMCQKFGKAYLYYRQECPGAVEEIEDK